MVRTAAVLALGILSGPTAGAQEEDVEALKNKILERVREKLELDRRAILERVERLVDEELSEGAEPVPVPRASRGLPAETERQIRELERKLRVLKEDRETIEDEIGKLRRQAEDEPVKEEARRDGPHDDAEAQEMFDRALKLHVDHKNYEEAAKLWRKIYYRFPETMRGAISAYNAACAYALAGRKDEALDWLETSVQHGYADFDHMRKDPDLDRLRNEKRYKKLLVDR